MDVIRKVKALIEKGNEVYLTVIVEKNEYIVITR